VIRVSSTSLAFEKARDIVFASGFTSVDNGG